jgi:tRNA-splicing ligase RtcB
MKIINEKLPIKIWTEDIEDGALEQAKNLANLPFAFKHIAIMSDTHQGFGMPIGGVLATKGVVIPNAVGVDIGCGMCAIKTSLTNIDTETIKKIMEQIRKVIPVGFNKHKENQIEFHDFENSLEEGDVPDICLREWENASKSIGTLGGGNHFIEIQKGSDGYIWIMIHSGSRNLGKQVADYYNKLAVELNRKWFSEVPKEWELAFLPVDSEEGQTYIREMQYCIDFALANRKLMMDRIMEIFKNIIGSDFNNITSKEFNNVDIINIAHNYARLENHFGESVWVHRKGATLSTENTIGIIPGSQGTKSYIVKGKGNKESFMSCSHGAGRKMSRTQAIKELDLEKEIKTLDDLGIIHGIRNREDLDEAPSSYKNIDEVMENQKDLVEILVELTPLAVVKG